MVGLGTFEKSEVLKPMVCSLVPMRLEPFGELAWIEFDTSNGKPGFEGLITLILDEVTPFIIGVGQVIAEKTTEGFKIFKADDWQARFSHDTFPVEKILA